MRKLNEPDFTPKTHINEYLNEINPFFTDEPKTDNTDAQEQLIFWEKYLQDYPNVDIFNELTKKSTNVLWDPLEFFNIFYRSLAIVRANKDKPYDVKDYLMSLDLQDNQKLYLLTHIAERIRYESGWNIIKRVRAVKDERLFFISKFLAEEATYFGMEKFPDKFPSEWELEIEETPLKPWNYSWTEFQKAIESAPNANSKLEYLINVRTQYKQTYPNRNDNDTFIKQCNLEIEKIKELSEIQNLETHKNLSPEGSGNALFSLSSKRGKKADFIRLLNALYALQFVETKDGVLPNKDFFMEKMGAFFGVDLSDYHADLSQALRASLESNVKIFEDLKSATQKAYYERNQ